MNGQTAGPTGAMGPAGPAGPAGLTGARGSSGTDNGWDEYKRMLLDDRDRNREDHKEMFEMLRDLKADVSALKAKAGIWGALAGAVAAAAATLGIGAVK